MVSEDKLQICLYEVDGQLVHRLANKKLCLNLALDLDLALAFCDVIPRAMSFPNAEQIHPQTPRKIKPPDKQ